MRTYVKIEGISCSHCLDTIETNLLKEKNITKVKFQKILLSLTMLVSLKIRKLLN